MDWALAVYSGFPGFGRISAGPIGLPPGTPPDFIPPVLVFETYPRFTMIGGDAETVRGDWAIRGEMAVTTGDTIVTGTSPLGLDGHSVRAGIGADRKAGTIRLNGTVLVEHRVADAQPQLGIAGGADTNVSLVVGGDRGVRQGHPHASASSARGTSPTAPASRGPSARGACATTCRSKARSAGSSARATTPSRASPSATSSRYR